MIRNIIDLFKEGGVGRLILKDLFFIFLIGGILFGVSGAWPPLVAIESESMEPNLHQGDLVFVLIPHAQLIPTSFKIFIFSFLNVLEIS